MEFRTYIGNEITSVIPQLGELRIQVFREFPYLYEGSITYESEYLKTYSASKYSFLFTIWENEKMIGATTCIPLCDEMEEIKKPFLNKGIDCHSIVYFGESILLKEYRGLGFGKLFFDKRIEYVKNLKEFSSMYFCAVERPADHHLKPNDYKDLTTFWNNLGFQLTDLSTQLEWKDLDNPFTTLKNMIFWKKELEMSLEA